MKRTNWGYAGLLMTALVFSGCQLEDITDPVACEQNSDCANGEICGTDGACTKDESTTCTQDFNCKPGEVCSLEGLCSPAAPNAKRTFAIATIEAQSEDDVFLISVASLPTDTQAPTGDPTVLFTLGGVASENISKKRMASRAEKPIPSAWRAQIEFDARRHQAINDLIDGFYAGRRDIRPTAYKNSSCECDSLSMCWNGNCETNIVAKFPDGTDYSGTFATVVGNDAVEVNVVVESSLDGNADAINKAKLAATTFAASLQDQLSYFGKTAHDASLDRDDDGRLNIFFTKEQYQSGIVGFFNANDFFPATDAQASGNESDILWAHAPIGENNTANAVGTLVHEYVHLASYGIRVYGRAQPVNEELWLDEAMAHTMEDLMGWGTSNITAAEAALSSWAQTGFASTRDSVELRGMGYTLIRYLIDQDAASKGATSATDAIAEASAKTILTQLMTQDAKGFKHNFFQNQGSRKYSNWLLALHTDGNDDALESSKTAGYLSPGTDENTQNLKGFNPRGSFTDAFGEDVELEGLDAEEELDGASEVEDGEVYAGGGSILYLISGLEAGSHTIKAVGDAIVSETATDLHLSITQVE